MRCCPCSLMCQRYDAARFDQFGHRKGYFAMRALRVPGVDASLYYHDLPGDEPALIFCTVLGAHPPRSSLRPLVTCCSHARGPFLLTSWGAVIPRRPRTSATPWKTMPKVWLRSSTISDSAM